MITPLEIFTATLLIEAAIAALHFDIYLRRK